jgi:anaphase-promoting complex subunit 8
MADLDRSASLFESLVDEHPCSLDFWDVYSNILYVCDDAKKLSILAQKASQVHQYRPETNCIIGNYFSLKRMHDKALVYFYRAIKLNPNYHSIWTLIGHEYIELKNSTGAIEAYRRALDLNGNDYRAWYGLGQAYELMKMLSYAAIYYKKACELKYAYI